LDDIHKSKHNVQIFSYVNNSTFGTEIAEQFLNI